MSSAGFRHATAIERDHNACETVREKQGLHLHTEKKWPLLSVMFRISIVEGRPMSWLFRGGRCASTLRRLIPVKNDFSVAPMGAKARPRGLDAICDRRPQLQQGKSYGFCRRTPTTA